MQHQNVQLQSALHGTLYLLHGLQHGVVGRGAHGAGACEGQAAGVEVPPLGGEHQGALRAWHLVLLPQHLAPAAQLQHVPCSGQGMPSTVAAWP